MSFVGLGAGKMLTWKQLGWQLTWWEQKRAKMITLLRESENVPSEQPLSTLGIFSCKEQGDSLIIRTHASEQYQRKTANSYSVTPFSRLHRNLSSLTITSLTLISACVINWCLSLNDIKEDTSMTPVKWAKNLVWGLIFAPANYLNYPSQWEEQESEISQKNVSQCVMLPCLSAKMEQPLE